MNAEVLLHVSIGISPDFMKDLSMCQRPSGVSDECAQDGPLGFGEMNHHAVLLERWLGEID